VNHTNYNFSLEMRQIIENIEEEGSRLHLIASSSENPIKKFPHFLQI
jgi:hypothetical protein